MRWFLGAVCAISMAVAASAQQAQPNKYSGHGYVHFGIAGAERNFDTVYSAGVGGEGFLYKGLAAGASLEMLSAYENIASTVGVLSPTASWHFVDRNKEQHWVPFVSGGYSLGFSTGGHANGYNFGGGITWWFKPKYGVRTEFRDQVFEGRHLYVFRFGLAFR